MKNLEIIIAEFNVVPEGYYSNHGNELLSYPAEGYDFCFAIEDDSYWFQHRNHIIKNFVGRYKLEGSFADVGGGNGVVTKALEGQENLLPILIEPAKQGCVNATKRNVKHIVKATLTQLIEKQFECKSIGLVDVIEHIENVEDFLQEIRQIIAPSAKIFITVPAYQNLWSEEDREAGHYRRYNLKLAKKQLEDAGFKLIEHSYFFSILPVPIFLKRVLKAKQGTAKKEDYILPKTIFGKIVSSIFELEKRIIAKHYRIPFGSSLFLVAEVDPRTELKPTPKTSV